MATPTFIIPPSITESIESRDTMISSSYSLLSPPISNSRATAKLPSLVDRAFSDSSISDTRSTSHRGRDKDLAELRPLLFNKRGNSFSEYLPPIQDVMTPSASPSPPFDSYFVSSSPSSIASSPTPADDEPYLSFSSPPQDHLIVLATPTSISPVSDRRKGSIASLLNSDPELRQLDEEENKCNYLSHFVSPIDMQLSSSLKRGRPRHDVIDQNATMKKRKCQLPASCKSLDNSTAFDCLQACQSTATENTNSKLSVLSDTPRATKGLRHFSKQVCDKVAEKGVTTYNEVADELALDIKNSENENGERHVYDQKNIRRRVYDALNVLMAMNIITKDKKVIKWLGIPKCYQQIETNNETDMTRKSLLQQIEEEENKQNELMTSLNKLRGTINDKLAKHLQIRNLVWRNQQIETPSSKKIPLPFLIITCPPDGEDLQIDLGQDSKSAEISFTSSSSEYSFIYKDSDLLRHLGFSEMSQSQISTRLPDPKWYPHPLGPNELITNKAKMYYQSADALHAITY